MTESLYGTRSGTDRAWVAEPPDPIARPEYYDGIVMRRSLAYGIDCLILLAVWAALVIFLSIFGVVTLGLGFHLFALLPLVPIAYSTLLIGSGQSATWGMRLMDVEIRSWGGDRPNMLQALVMTLLFYATIAVTWFFGLLVVFFNTRRRAAHDFLAGTVAVRRLPVSVVSQRQA
jgi:uncharacterized RDD family membrane protein YckC